MRATFRCRACAFDSPFDGIELDNSMLCAQCGTLQRINSQAWTDSLRFAHDVADLAGPDPEGQHPHPFVWIGDENPYKLLGVSETFIAQPQESAGAGGALPKFDIAPGHPICADCKAPLNVGVQNQRTLTDCPKCRKQEVFELSAEARRCYPALFAIVGAEHLMGRPRANLATRAGAVSVECPQCGAPLPPTRVGVVDCGHCRSAAYVPARARKRDSSALALPEPFFVGFKAPSSKRAQLERVSPPTTNQAAKLKSLVSRGLKPLPGIELAPRKPGLDFRQLGLMAVGGGLALLIAGLLVGVLLGLLPDLQSTMEEILGDLG